MADSKGNIFTHNSDDRHRAYADVTGGWINPKVGHVILVSKNAGATGKEKPAVDSAVSSSKFVSSAASTAFSASASF